MQQRMTQIILTILIYYWRVFSKFLCGSYCLCLFFKNLLKKDEINRIIMNIHEEFNCF